MTRRNGKVSARPVTKHRDTAEKGLEHPYSRILQSSVTPSFVTWTSKTFVGFNHGLFVENQNPPDSLCRRRVYHDVHVATVRFPLVTTLHS